MHVLYNILPILLFLSIMGCLPVSENTETPAPDKLLIKLKPHDEFFLSRAYPFDDFGLKAYDKALRQAALSRADKNFLPGFDLPWDTKGPANLGARINTVIAHPANEQIMLVGFSDGGIFKTTNGGQHWYPVFDDQAFLAIGCLAYHPTNPDIVYAGTGDPNIGSYVTVGGGLYRSEDGGESWYLLGLPEQRIISRIVIDPENSETIYVGSMGLPFERNNDRGLYRSTDGGNTWQQVLFVSDQAGIIDLVMDPFNPQVLYAASWDRIRTSTESIVEGPHARIYKTTDAGTTWIQLSGGLPLTDMGRIGLAVSQTTPNRVFALYVGLDRNVHNIFRSDNAGQSWAQLLNPASFSPLPENALGGFGWFFGQLRVSPLNDQELYVLGVDMYRSLDGGNNWELCTPPWFFYSVHADKHDMIFTPSGARILATDGGLYRSLGEPMIDTWEDIEDIPTTQFYRVACNPHQPDWYYGGAQDNGSTGGPELSYEWPRIFGGDGFQMRFRNDDPDIMYCETQNGGIRVSLNAGTNWFSATAGIEAQDRRNWDMPYFLSQHNPDVLYTGTYRAYQSSAGPIPEWTPISEDLTDGNVFGSAFHTISAIDESPLVQGLLYAGTSDGNLWRFDNGEWISISEGLPKRYVTDIQPSPSMPDRVYVSFSGYRDNEFVPRIYRSDDRGNTWLSISADLPDLAINDLFVLPMYSDSVLFVATDGGVYGSLDAGESWGRLGNNMPIVRVFHLELNPASNELVAGTFARAIMAYPLDSIQPQQETPVAVREAPVYQGGKLHIWPNPATSVCQVSFHTMGYPEYELVLLDAQGRLVRQYRAQQSGEVQQPIPLLGLTPGIYTVKVKLKHQVLSGRVVVAR
jgi:photosystem II stability/assembly factor-like uncharacterized protein